MITLDLIFLFILGRTLRSHMASFPSCTNPVIFITVCLLSWWFNCANKNRTIAAWCKSTPLSCYRLDVQDKPAFPWAQWHRRRRSCRRQSARLWWSSPRRCSRIRRWGTPHLLWPLCKLRQENQVNMEPLSSPPARPRAASQTPAEKMALSHGIIIVCGLQRIKRSQLKACKQNKTIQEKWRDAAMYSNYGFHRLKKITGKTKQATFGHQKGWKWALVNGFLSDENESGKKLWIIFALCDAALFVIFSICSPWSRIYKVLHNTETHKQILCIGLSPLFQHLSCRFFTLAAAHVAAINLLLAWVGSRRSRCSNPRLGQNAALRNFQSELSLNEKIRSIQSWEDRVFLKELSGLAAMLALVFLSFMDSFYASFSLHWSKPFA